jgi:hypothetical protein
MGEKDNYVNEDIDIKLLTEKEDFMALKKAL